MMVSIREGLDPMSPQPNSSTSWVIPKPRGESLMEEEHVDTNTLANNLLQALWLRLVPYGFNNE